MRAAQPGVRRRDVRFAAIAASVALIAAGGALIAFDVWRPDGGEPYAIDARLDPAGHVRVRKEAEFEARFQQAVVMLHARQYDHAATALHRLLELAPEVPEVHVNMGYAMLGLQRYDAARDFFAGATELRPRQTNAYYGLAVALEALGDIPGALGAMRTYVHLGAPDDPYVRKANSAIWEWETRVAAKK